MTFSGGVFSPTGKNAILNVVDLENALADGSATVTTGTSVLEVVNVVSFRSASARSLSSSRGDAMSHTVCCTSWRA